MAKLPAITVVGVLMQMVWFGPALATVGTWLTVIETVELEEAQGLFEMVHAKTFTPKPKPVMVVFGNNEFVMAPLPEIKVHAQVPTAGLLAAISALGLETQTVWFGPAFAAVGI